LYNSLQEITICTDFNSTQLFLSLSLSAIEGVTCDPPCTGNKVCQNDSGLPECVCADGFGGEDNCTGTINRISSFSFHCS